MGIMFTQNLFVKLHHLHAYDKQPFALETGYYLSYKAAVYGHWFDYD